MKKTKLQIMREKADMTFQNNRITEIECAKCEAQIRYTVKSEVVE